MAESLETPLTEQGRSKHGPYQDLHPPHGRCSGSLLLRAEAPDDQQWGVHYLNQEGKRTSRHIPVAESRQSLENHLG